MNIEFNFKLPHYAKQMSRSACPVTSLLTLLLCYFIRLKQNLHLHIKWQVHNRSFYLEPALIFSHILRHHMPCATVTKHVFKQQNCVLIVLSVQQQCWGFEQILFKARSKGKLSQRSHSVCKTEFWDLPTALGCFLFGI